MAQSLFIAGLSGFLLGTSLIVAIGAQNAFILRQGLLRSHVFVLCFICAFSDMVLIALGVAGFGTIVRTSGWLIEVVTLAGAAFLIVYGFLALRRAIRPATLQAANQKAGPLMPAVLTCLALTFLNPHVYLDTVILLGGLSAQYVGYDRLAYGVGAAMGSFAWFFSLGYGARFLSKIFEKPKAWQILDIGICLVMWAIAFSLIASLW